MHRKKDSDQIPVDTELEKRLRSLRKTKRVESVVMADEKLMRRSAKVSTKEDSYGAGEVKYVNKQRRYHFMPNPNLPTH